MAVWQYDLYFMLAESAVCETSGEDWTEPRLPLPLVFVIQETLSHYFGPPWRMLEDWVVFGPENGNRVDVLFEEADYASVFVRCDVRIEAPQFLLLVADLARFHGCKFFSAQHRTVVEPVLEALQQAVDRSGAALVPGWSYGR